MNTSHERRVILLVDDNEQDHELMQRAFQRVKNPHPVVCLMDGSEAISYLQGTGIYHDREKFPLPSLMLLDLKMPKKDGLEVLYWIKKHPGLKRLIVAVLSASPNEADVERAYDLGANCFFVKPSTLEELTALAELICRWIQVNRFPMNGAQVDTNPVLLSRPSNQSMV